MLMRYAMVTPSSTQRADNMTDDTINMNDLELAYEVSPASITNVLRRYSLRVANTDGRPFEEVAEELFFDLDIDLIEHIASKQDDVQEQQRVAEAIITNMLIDWGVLDLQPFGVDLRNQ